MNKLFLSINDLELLIFLGEQLENRFNEVPNHLNYRHDFRRRRRGHAIHHGWVIRLHWLLASASRLHSQV